MTTPTPPPPPTGAPLPPAGYPITYTFTPPDKIARWRPLVHWLLAIPHVIVFYLINTVATFVAFIAWLLGVFTGKVPEGVLGFLALNSRYSARLTSYLLFLREEYPPFSFDLSLADPGDDPRVRVDVAPATEGRSRLTIFFRLLLAIPHFVVLGVLGIAVYVVVIIGWFAVIILGRWPSGLQGFLVGYLRWSVRAGAYYNLLTDAYPPFSFE